MRSVSDNTMQRDIQCFIRTYCQSRHNSNAVVVEESFDCPLVELNLISELPESKGYEFQRGEKETLPVEIFTATSGGFLGFHFSEREALTVLGTDVRAVKSRTNLQIRRRRNGYLP